MVLFHLNFSVLAFCAIFADVVQADFISDLTSQMFTVVIPGSPAYSNASTAFNLRYTFKPAAIVYPKTAQDVSLAMKIGAQFNYQVVARSGGHSYIANGLGGKSGALVIDMSNFRTVSVDKATKVAAIGPGNRLGDVALALNAYGRALPHGSCPYVGIGGHSGYGGYGFTSRKWGLTLDTIQSLQVVLANGQIVTASQTSYPDLFWGLRGASSSFGIVTSINVNTFAAPDSTTIFEYTWDFSASDATAGLSAFQDYVHSPSLPQELGVQIVVLPGPSRGRVYFALVGGWYAPANEFDAVIQPLLQKLPKPAITKLTVGTYIDSVQYLGGIGRLNTTGIPDTHDTFYAKSLMTPEASPMRDQARQAFMSYLANEGFDANTNWFVEIELYGGTNSAINNVPLDATAFAHRNSMFTIQFRTATKGGLPPFPQEGFTLLDGMVDSILNNSPPNWDYGTYANYIDDRLANWQKLYYASHYPRLRSLKDKYDPKNTLTFPTAIQE